MGHFPRWIWLLRGLADHGLTDSLRQMAFPRSKYFSFMELMSVSLPEDVAATAAKSFLKSKPTSELSNLLSFALCGDFTGGLPAGSHVSLLLMPYLYAKRIPIPADCILTHGQLSCSISFYRYVCTKSIDGAAALMKLAEAQGDTSVKSLATAFLHLVLNPLAQDVANDVFQAMLIRFQCSLSCIKGIAGNYNRMLGQPLRVGYHTACALLDCRRYALLDKCSLTHLPELSIELLIDEIHGLKDRALDWTLKRLIVRLMKASDLLKSWSDGWQTSHTFRWPGSWHTTQTNAFH